MSGSGYRRRPGDGWVECGCGATHWGLHGAAGLLLARTDAAGAPTQVVLQHRSPESHHGGRWGIPGGAREPQESAVDAALRESAEEAGVPGELVRVLTTQALVHPDWSYTTVLAVATGPVEPRVTDWESTQVCWVDVDEVTDRELVPAFAAAWPGLLATLRTLLAPG